MYTLPTSVTVENKEFHIRQNADFRMVLDCFKALEDDELSEDYRVLASLIIFYEELNDLDDVSKNKKYIEQLVNEMYKFFRCGSSNEPGAVTPYKLIDWEKDSTMICAAVNNVANTEIRATPNLHWWTFVGYYMSVGQSVLSTVVSIREKIVLHKKLEKWEKEFKRDNPQYFVWNSSSIEDVEIDKAVREIWNKGGVVNG